VNPKKRIHGNIIYAPIKRLERKNERTKQLRAARILERLTQVEGINMNLLIAGTTMMKSLRLLQKKKNLQDLCYDR
jgi:hypothetical protein